MSIRFALLLFSFGWSLQTIDDKLYRSAVTDAWVDGLVRVVPMDPSLYNGVIILNADPSMIGVAAASIEEKLDLPHRGLIYVHPNWASTALASGFRDATMCGFERSNSQRLLCDIAELLCESYSDEGTGSVEPYGLYDLRCVLNRNVVVSINRRFLSGSAAETVGSAVEDRIGHRGLVARADFNIYMRDRKLYYVKDSCTQADIRGVFFLHIFPNDLSDLSEGRIQYGFDNLDHKAELYTFMRDASCVLMVELPDYPISHVITGRSIPGQPAIWSVEFMIGGESQETLLPDGR